MTFVFQYFFSSKYFEDLYLLNFDNKTAVSVKEFGGRLHGLQRTVQSHYIILVHNPQS